MGEVDNKDARWDPFGEAEQRGAAGSRVSMASQRRLSMVDWMV